MHGRTNTSPERYGIIFQFGAGGVDNVLIISDPALVNTIYHVAITRNSNNSIQTYLNGVLRNNSLISTFDFTTNTYNYNIGRSGFGENFTDNVYSWRHYNRALTTEEIQQNFNANKGIFGL